MTRLYKEVYQPARTATDHSPMDDEDAGSQRLPRFIVIALLGLAGIATVVWFGYERGLDRDAGEIVLIAPPPGPVRTRPDEPGGTADPYAGLKVYERPQAPEAEAETSHLSPVASTETELTEANLGTGATPEPVPAAPPAGADASQPPEYLQIGAYVSQQLAEKAFREFQIVHAAIAADLLPDIRKADLGDKGIWYRLRIGPFAGKAAAAQSCEKMKKEGVTCLLAAR